VSTRRPSWGVTVTREDGLWVAVVDGLAGGATDVEHFDELDTEVRDLVAGLTDADPHEFDIEWHFQQNGHDYTPALQQLHEWESEAENAIKHRDASRRAAIVAMRGATLSYRDIADILGLSHQRVAQLAAEYQQQAS
jgi:DNA-directed RNA polymerase specialized sigma24 family protein